MPVRVEGRRARMALALAIALLLPAVAPVEAGASDAAPQPAARRAAERPAMGRPAAGRSAAERPAGVRPKAERTLDAITIEGEIAVPQVLFITSREQPRYQDLLHRRYLRTSVDVGEQWGLPSRVLIKESRP